MKRITVIGALCLCLLAGCGKGETPVAQTPVNVAAAQQDQQRSAPVQTWSLEDLEEAQSPAVDGQPAHGALTQRPAGDVVEINEKVFIAQTNDIYLNVDDYLGKTIRYEGIYQTEIWEMDGYDEEIHYVIRYGPGCCGTDGNAGFEVVWDGEYPEQNDWVAVEGRLQLYELGEFFYLQLHLDSLEVKEERGAETVLM